MYTLYSKSKQNKTCRRIFFVFKSFLQNTTFQCYHYLVDPDLHWSERIFWFICIGAASGYGTLLMIRSVIELRSTSINLTVDTNYVQWESNYPAVIVCEKMESNPSFENIDKYVNVPPDTSFSKEVLSKYAAELVFFNGAIFHLRRCNDPEYWVSPPVGDEMVLEWQQTKTACEILKWNITKIIPLRRDCQKMFQRCTWNDEEFDCCKLFLPINTIYGVCYAWNSIVAMNSERPVHTARSDDVEAVLSVFFKVESDAYSVYAVSREDTLSHRYAPKKNLFAGSFGDYAKVGNVYIRVKNIANDDAVRNIPLEIRNCRFPDENNLQMSKIYSYSACMVEQFVQKQLEMCKCTQFYLPELADSKLFCTNLVDVLCLSSSQDLIQMSLDVQQCMVSCVESEVTILGMTKTHAPESQRSEQPEEESYVTAIIIRFQAMRIQYHRRVMRDTIDLIVNVGGIGTIFFGASVISIVEMFYYFLIYPWNPRVDVVKFDVKPLMNLPKNQRQVVLSYVDFKEKMLNGKNEALYPFCK